MESKNVLIVDDEQSIRGLLSTFLGEMGVEPLSAPTAEDALILMDGESFAVALVDIRLPGMDGLELLREIKKISPDTEVIIITSFASLDTAIDAIRKGAYDYLRKPFEDLDQVWVTVERAFEKRKLSLQNRDLLGEMERRNLELTAAVKRQTSLIEAGRAMSGIHNLQELLDCFLKLVVEELDVDRASLMLLDGSNGDLRIASFQGLDEKLVKTVTVSLGEGIAGWVAREGKPILVKDIKSDPRSREYLNNPNLSNSFISAPIVLSIPIKRQEKVLGVINVTNRRSGEPFNEDDMAFIFSMAGQAAVAIEGAKHFEDLQEAYESLKSTQDHLVATERLKALGQMAAGVAHDFNNILNGILGTVQLTLPRLKGSAVDMMSICRELEVVEKLSLQGGETVKRIQDFAGIRKDHPDEAVDINEVVRNALDMTRSKWKDEPEAGGISIEVRMDLGDVPSTVGNTFDLSQVFSNLIFNAVEAMPEGGLLTVRTAHEDGLINLDIEDSGIGMSDEVKVKIFEPFFTTKESGHGLGLSVIHGVVARYGGSVSVHSAVGEGSTFRLKLPVVSPRMEITEEREMTQGDYRPARVLVIEDDELNRKLLKNVLEQNKHDVSDAPSGEEGLLRLDNEPFDLVITDLGMPGMSGWDVAKGVKERNPNIPVILLSGWAVQQDKDELKAAGVDHVLSKPCPMAELYRMVDKALRERSGAN